MHRGQLADLGQKLQESTTSTSALQEQIRVFEEAEAQLKARISAETEAERKRQEKQDADAEELIRRTLRSAVEVGWDDHDPIKSEESLVWAEPLVDPGTCESLPVWDEAQLERREEAARQDQLELDLLRLEQRRRRTDEARRARVEIATLQDAQQDRRVELEKIERKEQIAAQKAAMRELEVKKCFGQQ